MKFFKETVRLLKEYGRFAWVVWDLSLMVTVMVLGFIVESGVLVGFSFFFPVLACWEISDVFLFEVRDILKKDLADTTDKLILSEHEAERLAIELDAVRAAFKAGERKWKEQAARMKEQADEPEPTTVETAPAEASKPRPKRRPAPKRKPKQTENVNEKDLD